MFAGILISLNLVAGCQPLAGSRVESLVNPTSPPTSAVTDPLTKAPTSQPTRPPGFLVGSEPESGLQPSAQVAREPGPIAVANADRPPAPSIPTPILDAALDRVKAQEATLRTTSQSDRGTESQPPTPDAIVTALLSGAQAEAGAGTGPESSPNVIRTGGPQTTGPSQKAPDPKLAATESLSLERSEEPDASRSSRPINPDLPVEPAKPRDVWREALDRLRSVARDRARESGGDADGSWAIRARLLDSMDEPESPTAPEDGVLRQSLLAALAATTAPEPGVADASSPAAPIRAAVDALEARAPLEIIELQLCRKVKGFGDFEPLEAADCRGGRGVILYCEMDGLRYESEGPLFRSRLRSRVEVVPSGAEEPVWTHHLGTADDLCRRRRRDYYVNYRITLPASLAPGSYELRLIQDDLVADRSATRSVALVIQP